MMTQTEVFESVTNGGSSDFSQLVDVLDKHGKWCLVGGLAVNCYVEPVFTVDADVVVASANLGPVQAELIARGFEVIEYKHSVNAQMRGSELRNSVYSRCAVSDVSGGFVDTPGSGIGRPGSLSAEHRSWQGMGMERSKAPIVETQEG